MARVLLDFGAHALDMHVQRLGVADIVGAPDAVDQLVAGHHAALVLHEVFQQFEFLQREEHVLAADRHLMLADSHGNVTAYERNIVVGGFSGFGDHLVAAQHRADACQQLTEGIRFGDVVVRADFKADDLVDFRAFRGQHDDRHTALLADSAA